MIPELSCFKAYDVRGRIPDELNEDIAYRTGRAFAQFTGAEKVVVGFDIRLTSEQLCRSLSAGLSDGGADVLNIGMCATEEVYFATRHLNADGGICVTASHNPEDYNGMKFVGKDATPVSGDSGLREIERLTTVNNFPEPSSRGQLLKADTRQDYVQHLLSYIQPEQCTPLKIVCNAGNGTAGAIINRLSEYLPFELIKIHHEPDGTFPHGVPNPLIPENRAPTTEAIRQHNADLGIAWDGDSDRCFFFDHEGTFIEGYYITGLLADAFLQKHPGERIVHDARLIWNTQDIVHAHDGIPIESKTGHAFMKERMRKENAVYGGEMSAHHYFRDFAYCDSGMIPWLLIAELISIRSCSLKDLISKRMDAYPCSGEINLKIADPAQALRDLEEAYLSEAVSVSHIDGLSMNFGDWRFNVRASNTEPVVRVNVESRGNRPLMERQTSRLLGFLDKFA